MDTPYVCTVYMTIWLAERANPKKIQCHCEEGRRDFKKSDVIARRAKPDAATPSRL